MRAAALKCPGREPQVYPGGHEFYGSHGCSPFGKEVMRQIEIDSKGEKVKAVLVEVTSIGETNKAVT